MIRTSIRYTLDVGEDHDLERHAQHCADAALRCGGVLEGYYVPAPLSGPAVVAFAVVTFVDVATYEQYRTLLMQTLQAEAANNASFDGAFDQSAALFSQRRIATR